MIGFIQGKIETLTDKYIITNVNGVGYKIFITLSTFKNLPKKGEEVKLYTHLYVRENILDLYGFLKQEELEFFEKLVSISGIGPKGALGVLSVASVKSLKKAISSGESEILTKVSGIGKKMAAKIVLELKTKIEGDFTEETASFDNEAIDALVALGYKANEAREALSKIPEDTEDIGDKVRQALKLLGKNN
ncbi:MAG: Holliday junction branch migration protein RuvA [Candidatus Portnoybacteria bacterium]|nr:Holliday junction branch migration protein RuvA [Candidatus Portnoybacteria bacterium]